MPEPAITYMFPITTAFEHMMWNEITDIIHSVGVEARYIYEIDTAPHYNSHDYDEVFSGPILQDTRYVRIFIYYPDLLNVYVLLYELAEGEYFE